MDKILILFSTTDGHTVSICNRIAEVLSINGSVTITSLEDCSELEIKSADKVLVGASIRMLAPTKTLSALFISSSEQSSRLVIVTDPLIDKTSAIRLHIETVWPSVVEKRINILSISILLYFIS